MIVVIQCASSKMPSAGHLVTAEGRSVTFVAHPEIAPKNERYVYARPDEDSAYGKSWREVLPAYNRELNNNPLRLLPAFQLYENPVYERLVQRLGVEDIYILSAGWGLIRSDFLTPDYDITFSPIARGADAYKRRRKGDRYDDFRMLHEDTEDDILFFGGKDYVPLFCALTQRAKAKRKIFHSAGQPPPAPDCTPIKFETTTRTNWHYECANALVHSLQRERTRKRRSRTWTLLNNSHARFGKRPIGVHARPILSGKIMCSAKTGSSLINVHLSRPLHATSDCQLMG